MKVLILRGVQGSGKSTFCFNLIKNTTNEICVVSADHYFEQDDRSYQFDITKLSEAHASCMRSFIQLLRERAKVVIVDNTNATAWECSPYVLVAQAYKVDVAIYTIQCDPTMAAARNIHGVPELGVLRKHEQLQSERLPSMWQHFTDEAAVMEWLRT